MSLLHSLSIRWRLALLTAGLTFLVLCAFALVIGQLTASRIRSDFNNEMAAAVDDLRDQLQLDYDSGDIVVGNSIATYAAPNHAVIRVLKADSGKIIAETRHAPNFGLPGVAVNRTDTVDGYRVETRNTTLKIVNLPRGVVAQPVPVAVQYAREISDVEATVSRVRLFLLLGVLGGSGIALALGLALSRRALAPIARLTQTARDIGATRDPSRRVAIPDTDDEVAVLARTLDEMLQALESSPGRDRGAPGPPAPVRRRRQPRAAHPADERAGQPRAAVRRARGRAWRGGALGTALDAADAPSGRRPAAAGPRRRRSRRAARADRPHARGRRRHRRAASPVAVDHVLGVDAAGPAMVDGARDELHRMALNLMQNAVQHTPPGTHVTAAVRRDGDHVILTVTDDGPGIPPELRDSAFDRFVRGDGDRGGSVGLGLSIVRAVARTHGGDVVLESPAAGGARFVVTLPALPAAVAASNGSPGTPAVTGRRPAGTAAR